MPCKHLVFAPLMLTKVCTTQVNTTVALELTALALAIQKGHFPLQAADHRQDSWTEWCLAFILEGGQDLGNQVRLCHIKVANVLGIEIWLSRLVRDFFVLV